MHDGGVVAFFVWVATARGFTGVHYQAKQKVKIKTNDQSTKA
jgi:hypothetical protein